MNANRTVLADARSNALAALRRNDADEWARLSLDVAGLLDRVADVAQVRAELATDAIEELVAAVCEAALEEEQSVLVGGLVQVHAAIVAVSPGARDVWMACDRAVQKHVAAQTAAVHAGPSANKAQWAAGARRGRVDRIYEAVERWEREQQELREHASWLASSKGRAS